MTIEDALEHPDCPLKPRYLSIVKTFVTFINQMKESSDSLEEKLNAIFNFVGFDAFIRKFDNHLDRFDNIKELSSKLKEVSDLKLFR